MNYQTRVLRLIALLLVHLIAFVSAEDPWLFSVIADWHGAESFATNPGDESKSWIKHYSQIQYVQRTFGGDLALMPGDSNSGKWDTVEYRKKIKNWSDTVRKIVLEAGRNCYGTMYKLFTKAGYKDILMTIGDHELGGNPWVPGTKLSSLSRYRQSFVEGFNRDSEGAFRFLKHIGMATSTPLGTEFEYTSYAHQHKNVLFITIDAFTQHDTNIFDRELGLGGEGVVSCTVEGGHLKWFEKVLIEANKDDTIKHIIVQSHIPVAHPVRTIVSSGQFMDNGEESIFWKMMVKYSVDLYFAGEVHANTVLKDRDSNLLQVTSRGNQLNNFLQVSVTDDFLKITAYNEIGPKAKLNKSYVVHGNLTISKSNSGTIINSSGALEVLDRSLPLVHFNFEEIVPLNSRQVLGMKHDKMKRKRVADTISIRGVESGYVLPNVGSFGQQYDAQIANIVLQNGIHGENAGRFTKQSRVSIYSTSPHNGGDIISYALWFRTKAKIGEMILIHFGHSFAPGKAKNIFTVTLRDGTPILYTNVDSKLSPMESYNLDDGQWNHVAISMPKRSCRPSEVVMYINGKTVETIQQGPDEPIFFITSGRTSLGGFGMSSLAFDDDLSDMVPFRGRMDQFFMWAKTLTHDDLSIAMEKKFKHYTGRRCISNDRTVHLWLKYKQCNDRCYSDINCWGFSYKIRGNGRKPRCAHYHDKRPDLGVPNDKWECVRAT